MAPPSGTAAPAARGPAPAPRQPGTSAGTARETGTGQRSASSATDRRGGYGTWRLRVANSALRVGLGPIPVADCDHRYESSGYRPSETLRHLVQVRDGCCTQPVCVRHARRCDFDHTVPWHKGGRSCACNGGCRCRHDHKLKQTPGWAVSQPLPGWHQWTTPSGKTYTKGPKEYPI